jgi:undecaprenyl-diphosphatase
MKTAYKTAVEKPETRVRLLVEWLHSYELSIVRRQVELARKRGLQGLAVTMNELSNGWLFALYGIVLLSYQGLKAGPVILAALLALGIAHLVYPVIKWYLGRLRPMERDATLASAVRPLDRYSCPSGHCMTATALSIPIAFVEPAAAVVLLPMLLVIAWARLAVAHHYPSDVLFGILLGYSVAWPVSELCLR